MQLELCVNRAASLPRPRARARRARARRRAARRTRARTGRDDGRTCESGPPTGPCRPLGPPQRARRGRRAHAAPPPEPGAPSGSTSRSARRPRSALGRRGHAEPCGGSSRRPPRHWPRSDFNRASCLRTSRLTIGPGATPCEAPEAQHAAARAAPVGAREGGRRTAAGCARRHGQRERGERARASSGLADVPLHVVGERGSTPRSSARPRATIRTPRCGRAAE